MEKSVRDYAVVTGAYWTFTLTDGALRMLVVLYFHQLGYTPLQVATLFLFYELFGVATNLGGGWLGARIGLDHTMLAGMALQIVALAMLCVPAEYLGVAYVMFAQALSGVAKDLNKMAAKASLKALAGTGREARLFTWVTALTGSKNALKGVGFFVGAALLEGVGFRGALALLAVALGGVLVATRCLLPRGLGRLSARPRFGELFSRLPAINRLAAARLCLFAARDAWFVVGLPVFLYERYGWSFMAVGAVLALWVIGYGGVQALAPRLLAGAGVPDAPTARRAVAVLCAVPALLALALEADAASPAVVLAGLAVFGLVFALNSAVHSYLVLAYADGERVALDVGFYYMANAAGRLLGTVLSGYAYQAQGLAGCLWAATGLLTCAWVCSLVLPRVGAAAALGARA